MTTNSLTDRALRVLTRPKPAPVAIFDADVKQLQVRASVSGTVAFSVLKRPPARPLASSRGSIRNSTPPLPTPR